MLHILKTKSGKISLNVTGKNCELTINDNSITLSEKDLYDISVLCDLGCEEIGCSRDSDLDRDTESKTLDDYKKQIDFDPVRPFWIPPYADCPDKIKEIHPWSTGLQYVGERDEDINDDKKISDIND